LDNIRNADIGICSLKQLLEGFSKAINMLTVVDKFAYENYG